MLFLVVGILGTIIYVGRITQLLNRNYLTGFEANSLILQAVLTAVVAAPALVAAMIAVASLRSQERIQKELRRPILDMEVVSPLKPGASQYDTVVTVKITNLGPGPAMDTQVTLRAIGVDSKSIVVGLIGAGAVTEAEISISVQLIGQKTEIVTTYVDLFGLNWISSRTYAAFPANVGASTVYRVD